MNEIRIETIRNVPKKNSESIEDEYTNSLHWVGCGECDCTFKCNDGNDRCIRLNHTVANQNEKRI